MTSRESVTEGILHSNPFAALTLRYLDANGLRRDAHDSVQHDGERNRERYDDDDEDSIPDLIEVVEVTHEDSTPRRRASVRAKMAIENIPYVLLLQDVWI